MGDCKQNALNKQVGACIYLKSIEIDLYLPMFDYICENIIYINYLFLTVVWSLRA